VESTQNPYSGLLTIYAPTDELERDKEAALEAKNLIVSKQLNDQSLEF
jgi:hypothetical protein